MAKDSDDRDARKRVRKQWPREINYPDASHPIFSRPTVITFANNPTPPTPEPEEDSQDPEEVQPPRRYPRLKLVPMKFRDPSDPIYSNPTILGFVRSRERSSPDSETPNKPSSASPEDSEEKED